MLAVGVPITDGSVAAHSRHLNASGRSTSRVASRACALVRPVGVDAIRVCTAASNSLAALIDVIATLPLEGMINCARHMKALRVMTVIARRAWFATEAGRQVGASNSLVARLNQVALKSIGSDK